MTFYRIDDDGKEWMNEGDEERNGKEDKVYENEIRMERNSQKEH